MTVLFMYGPDTRQGRMFDRVGATECMGAAVLPDHGLVFDKPNMKNKDEGLPNLVELPGRETFGVLFELDKKQLDLLDGFFGGYERKTVRVRPLDGTDGAREAITFVARRRKTGLKPTKGTIDATKKGMEENSAAAMFLQEIASIEVLRG